MKSTRDHWMRMGIAAAVIATAGTAAFAYDRTSERPFDLLMTEGEAPGVDFIVTGPRERGVAEPVSAARVEAPAIRHRMRQH